MLTATGQKAVRGTYVVRRVLRPNRTTAVPLWSVDTSRRRLDCDPWTVTCQSCTPHDSRRLLGNANGAGCCSLQDWLDREQACR